MNRRFRKTAGIRGVFVVLASALMLVLAVLPAFAVHDLKFQLDGNTDPSVYGGDTAEQPYDWQSFLTAGGVNGSIAASTDALPAGFSAVGFAADPSADLSTQEAGDYQLPDKTVFATGSKDTLDVDPGWQCKKANNVGDKVDIINAYSAVYIDPGSGHQILYFGIEKSSPNGDSNVAVWFLRDGDVGCSSAGGGNQPFSGHHMEGDLLVVSAFTNGGSVANVAAYEWQGGDGADGHLSSSPVASGGKCGPPDQPETNNALTACAVTNETSAISPPWRHPDKNGGALDPLEFFEGAVDMTAAGLLDECFARFLANTRSSQSVTATIFDFATGELAICAPSTDLSVESDAVDDTIHTGDSVTLTFTEANDGNTVLTKPASTNFVTTDSADCTPDDVLGSDSDGLDSDSTHNIGDLDNDGVFDAGETWKFSCTFSPTADVDIVATGHGIDPQGHDITTYDDCTDSSTVICDPDEEASISITVLAPSTALTKTASAEVTYTYVETNDGNAPLTEPSGGFVEDDKCSPVTDVLGSADDSLDSDATHNVGDLNNDGVLDPGESFTFECTETYSGDTDVTNTATGHGIDPLGDDITYCTDPEDPPEGVRCDDDEQDSVQITIVEN